METATSGLGKVAGGAGRFSLLPFHGTQPGTQGTDLGQSSHSKHQ